MFDLKLIMNYLTKLSTINGLIFPILILTFYLCNFFFSKLISLVITIFFLLLFMTKIFIENRETSFLADIKKFCTKYNLLILSIAFFLFLLSVGEMFLIDRTSGLISLFYCFLLLIICFFLTYNITIKDDHKLICFITIAALYIISIIFDQRVMFIHRHFGPLLNINGSALLLTIIVYQLRLKNIYWLISLIFIIIFFRSAIGVLSLILLWFSTNDFKILIKKGFFNPENILMFFSTILFMLSLFFYLFPRAADYLRFENLENAMKIVPKISSVGALAAGSTASHFGISSINLESSVLTYYFAYGISGLLILALPILIGEYYLGFVLLLLACFSGALSSPILVLFIVLALLTFKLSNFPNAK